MAEMRDFLLPVLAIVVLIALALVVYASFTDENGGLTDEETSTPASGRPTSDDDDFGISLAPFSGFGSLFLFLLIGLGTAVKSRQQKER